MYLRLFGHLPYDARAEYCPVAVRIRAQNPVGNFQPASAAELRFNATLYVWLEYETVVEYVPAKAHEALDARWA